MTDREKLIDALVEAIEAAMGSVHDMDVTHADYAKASAAVLDLCVPKKLVWVYPSDGSAHDEDCRYEVTMWGNMSWWRLTRGVTGGGSYSGDFKDLEAAQAAAQAHADAAHWGNTNLS